MPSFYTRKGDDGMTAVLGKGRVAKFDPVPETLGALDEANAAIGMARAMCQKPENTAALLTIQRQLYMIMTEVAATSENRAKFPQTGQAQVAWLEEQIEQLEQTVSMPTEFIVPGDTLVGAAVDVARAAVRTAERRTVRLMNHDKTINRGVLSYLNRLSSLLFVMELSENQFAGNDAPSLAKIN